MSCCAIGNGFCARRHTLVERLGEAMAREDLPPDRKKEAVAEARERVSVHVNVYDACQSRPWPVSGGRPLSNLPGGTL